MIDPATLRILDLTDGLAPSAGRLLVGMGADVLRLQADDSPRSGPAETLHWHSGKSVLRIPAAEMEAEIARLAPVADVVLDPDRSPGCAPWRCERRTRRPGPRWSTP